MTLPLEGKWKLTGTLTNAAEIVLKDCSGLTIEAADGEYQAIRPIMTPGKPPFAWTIDPGQTSPDKTSLGGTASPPDGPVTSYGFTVDQWVLREKIVGMILPPAAADPPCSASDPGTWQADENGNVGDDDGQ